MSFQPIQPAQRSKNIVYAVRDVVLTAREAQAQGKSLIYLNIGDPNQFDFRTPAHIVDAICKALKDNRTYYAPSEGLPEARQAIRRQAERQGISQIQDVYIGNGASECIEVSLAALLNDGDNVLTPSPGYPLYPAVLAKLGCVENPYFLDEENDWQPDVDDIASRIDARTRAIVLINPNNPTGSVCRRDIMERIAELAARHNLLILADEIYDKLLIDGPPHCSIASLIPDHPVLTFNGLSKAYLGPGLRLGWCIVSGPQTSLKDYIEAIHKFLRARLCASNPVQHAVVPALEGEQGHLDEVIPKLKRRRDVTVERLNRIDGIHCVTPAAAFYAFPRLDLSGGDDRFVQGLIRETGVVVVHGSGFGQKPGTAHIRIVYLPPEETLHKAFSLLENYWISYRNQNRK